MEFMQARLTIDDDIAQLLQQETERSGTSFELTANRMLRAGLKASQQNGLKRFVVKPQAMGIPSIDSISELIEHIEGPEHR